MLDLSGVSGGGTSGQNNAEQERPYLAAKTVGITVKYPTQATLRRSSLSRVPENGMHGLKGKIRNGLA
jgi:hypothetical protein